MQFSNEKLIEISEKLNQSPAGKIANQILELQLKKDLEELSVNATDIK